MNRAASWVRFAGVVAFVLVSLSRLARAQTAPQVQVQLDADTVGVGDTVHLQMSATSPDAMPSDPQIGATPGFVVRGQNAAPSQTHISINGSRMDRYTLTVDWALRAQRVGTFAVGPPSVVVGNTRYAPHAITLHVVPAGQAPQRQRQAPAQPPMPFGFSPFDPWRGLFPGLDPNDHGLESQSVTVDPKLALDAPRGALYFLHATTDKASAVVGEQVTYSIHEYRDATASERDVEAEDFHDAQVPDFLKRPLLREDGDAIVEGYASVGGRIWIVTLVRRWALFPLRTGELVIGPASVGLARPRSVAGSKRVTETIQVAVTEPPLAGRPPGYVVGDVGRFALTAQVQPQKVEKGGAVGVEVELSGKGNLPTALAPPAKDGVEWLAPEVHEEVGPIGHEAFGGKRRFAFVVRTNRSGDVDLGTLALPFWDPEQKKYDVARARLGVVHVTASAASASSPSSDSPLERLPGLPSPREALSLPTSPRRHLADSPAFWLWGVAAGPLAFVLAVTGRAAGRRTRFAWQKRHRSPAADLRERVAAAHAACAARDARTADAAIVRVLEAAAVVHAGVSVRDAVGGAVTERLERAGVPPDAASSIAGLLRECEAARFSPDTSDVVTARNRWQRAQGAIRSLERRP
jgi:hypothetical protein